MGEHSLKDKTVKGVAWSGIDNVVQYGIAFIVGIVLARLLSPDDYGLIGIITIFTSVCNVIINSGFSTALIRKKDVSDDDYNTAFVINLLLSIVLYVIIYYCAPYIANYFGRQELVLLTRVTTVNIIIGALSIVQQTRLTKRIDFKSQTKITFAAGIISGIAGIASALLGHGVWALVIQTITLQTIKTVLLWVYNKWIPDLKFSKESFHGLFGFGWKMMLAGILDRVWTQLYQVVVGKYYSPATLGQYTRAKQFSMMFSENLTNVVQRVTFPVLSDIQDEKERLVAAYRKIIKESMFITLILMCSLAAISEPLLYCLIGPKWIEASHFLPLICAVGAFYPLHAINLNMLQIQGRSDLFLGLEIIKKIIAVGPLAVGALIGIYPMLYSSIVVSVLCFFLNSYYPGKILGYNSWMQIKDILPSLGISLVVAIPVYALKYSSLSYWVVLPLQIVLGSILLILICNRTGMEEYKEIKIIISRFLKSN